MSRGAGRIQRVYENVFKADPDTWLKANVLTLDMPRGLETRTPSLKFDTKKFIADLAGREKHWFVLVPDPKRARTGSPGKPARQAYLLTPAVEKYVAEYAEGDEFLTAIRSDEAFAAVEASPAYIEAAYVQYLRGKTTVPDTAVGHTSVKKERGGEGFNPDFVFTDVMNGCAWAITDDEEDEDSFTAWHYQSPSSNKAEASAFRHDKAPTDWFGVEEYGSGEHEGLFETTNLLFRNDQGWNVASQVNDVSHLDMNDVTCQHGAVAGARPRRHDAPGRHQTDLPRCGQRAGVRVGASVPQRLPGQVRHRRGRQNPRLLHQNALRRQ